MVHHSCLTFEFAWSCSADWRDCIRDEVGWKGEQDLEENWSELRVNHGKSSSNNIAYFPTCNETYFYHNFREGIRARKWNLIPNLWRIYKQRMS